MLKRIFGKLKQPNAQELFEQGLAKFQSPDLASAAELMRAAARMGHVPAQYNVGYMHHEGIAVSKDAAEALRWYLSAAEAGHPSAMLKLAYMHAKGEGVACDAQQSFSWTHRAALAGEPHAQAATGLAYREGKLVPQDYVESVAWLRKAADQGEASACSSLGIAYENGEGVQQNLAAAFEWQKRSADSGYCLGQYNLARLYLGGIGTQRNKSAAVHWFKKAAEQGNTDAQFCLGRHFMRGEGTDRDADAAALWLGKAADKDHALAQVYLAGLLADDDDIAHDFHAAMDLLDRAAGQGLDVAPIRLEIFNRRQCCFFAFHLFPDWIFGIHRTGDRVSQARVQTALPELWQAASTLAGSAGGTGLTTPTCVEHTLATRTWLTIRMPSCRREPEPYQLIVDASVAEPRIFVVEAFAAAQAAFTLAMIGGDGNHSICGAIVDPGLNAFIDSFEPPWLGGALVFPTGLGLLQHLTRYIQVNRDFEEVASKARM